MRNATDKQNHLRSNEHLGNKKTWHCESCEADVIFNMKSSQINSKRHLQKREKRLFLEKTRTILIENTTLIIHVLVI